ncbi:MAG: phosphoribosyltransferase [Acidimicrobiia bacterium]|nr:phosphoribosyltransferase [Acidimicrobiia bacterium]
MRFRFNDRTDAGRRLALVLQAQPFANPVVLGLPRGGVPVAYEIASALGAPLDILVVRKVGVPGHEELSMGAVGTGGVFVANSPLIAQLGIDPRVVEARKNKAIADLIRLERDLRGAKQPEPVEGRDVILVDDGLATGSTMRAALAVLETRRPSRIIVAVPVAPREVCQTLEAETDGLVCLEMPAPFLAVGAWYRSFDQTTTDEVKKLLDESRQ